MKARRDGPVPTIKCMSDTPEATADLRHCDAVDLVRSLPDGSVDLTVFSPPYDDIRDYDGKPAFDLTALGSEILRATSDGGICAMVIQDGTKDFAKSLTTFRTAVQWCDEVGWRLFETVIYRRAGKPGAWWSRRFRVDHEYILIFLKGARPRFFDKTSLMVPAKHAGKTWAGTQRLTSGDTVAIEPTVQKPLKCRGTVWDYASSNSERNPLKMQHPATYPDRLPADVIECFTKPGDLVLDPMVGSGTTAVESIKRGRRFVGGDISADYLEIVRGRIAAEARRDGPALTMTL